MSEIATFIQLGFKHIVDVFPGRVNIVQVTRNTDKHTVLFTCGDGRKRLF